MAEIFLYGIIGDEYDKLDAATVVTAIRAATGPLTVRINSPGGYVMEGIAILGALNEYPGKVTIQIDGLAASMASVIAMVGEEVIMAESALMMIHKPWDSAIGNAEELRATANKLDLVERQLIGIYAKRTGLDAGRLAVMLSAETWLTSQEALDLGFVTAIAPNLKIAALADVSACGFRNVPDQLKGAIMPPEQNNPEPAAQAVALERTRIGTIMSLCAKHDITVVRRQRQWHRFEVVI